MSYRRLPARGHLGQTVSDAQTSAQQAAAQQGVVPAGGQAVPPTISQGTAQQLSSLPNQVAVQPAQVTSLDFVPSWCKRLPPTPDATPAGVAAGQIGVLAFPYIKLTDDQIQSLLSGVYGGGGAGDVLVQATLLAISPTNKWIPSAPMFVASGWMPDPGAGVQTRGTLWFAFGGWQATVSAANFVNYVNAVVKAGTGVDPRNGVGGVYDALNPGGKTIGVGVIPKIASGKADSDLQNAAIASAVAMLQVLLALTEVFLLGATTTQLGAVTGNAGITDAVTQLTSSVAAAVAAAPLPAALLPQVPALVTQVTSATPDTCGPAVAAAQQAIAQLQAARAQISAGLGNVTAIQQLVAQESQPGGGPISAQVRAQMLAAANNAVSTSPLTKMAVGKNYFTCEFFANAQASVARQLQQIPQLLSQAGQNASVLSTNRDLLNQTLTAIDTASTQLNTAIQQSCLAWYLKNWGPAPAWTWLVGGGTLVLGGLIILKVRRRHRKEAERTKLPAATSAASGQAVAKNRSRRSRRRTSFRERRYA